VSQVRPDPLDSAETNRLITGVETTSEEVTVDSPSFALPLPEDQC
jgi:hypothetical protein